MMNAIRVNTARMEDSEAAGAPADGVVGTGFPGKIGFEQKWEETRKRVMGAPGPSVS